MSKSPGPLGPVAYVVGDVDETSAAIPPVYGAPEIKRPARQGCAAGQFRKTRTSIRVGLVDPERHAPTMRVLIIGPRN
jgi:hypothetical protein